MNKQLIPFPLPEHLSEFVASQMDSPVEILEDGTKAKALHIKRKGGFGKLIHRSLKKSNRPAFAEKGFTMYIAVSNRAGDQDKNVVAGKYSFLELGKEEISEIIAVFDSWFKTCLVHFVDGAVFAHKFNGKSKGIVHASITQFMEYYKISDSKTLFAALVKFYDREKRAERPSLQRLS